MEQLMNELLLQDAGGCVEGRNTMPESVLSKSSSAKNDKGMSRCTSVLEQLFIGVW